MIIRIHVTFSQKCRKILQHRSLLCLLGQKENSESLFLQILSLTSLKGRCLLSVLKLSKRRYLLKLFNLQLLYLQNKIGVELLCSSLKVVLCGGRERIEGKVLSLHVPNSVQILGITYGPLSTIRGDS